MNARELTPDQIAQARLYDNVNGPFPYVANMSLVRKMIRRGETPPWFYMSSTQERLFYELVASIKTGKPVVKRPTTTYCSQGHARILENTLLVNGRNLCRACWEIRHQKADEKNEMRAQAKAQRVQRRDQKQEQLRDQRRRAEKEFKRQQKERILAINEKRKQDNLLACQPNTP